MEVHNELGFGFLEKVFENALMVLFDRESIHARQLAAIPVNFHGKCIVEYFADILVEGEVIL